MYDGVEVYLHTFLTSVRYGGERSASRCGRFTRGEGAPDRHWIGEWVCLRASLDAVKRKKSVPLLGIEPRSPSP
jgi:hypothetical protein